MLTLTLRAGRMRGSHLARASSDAVISIPLMLMAFTSLCSVMLKFLANRLAGRKRDLPVKTFRMMDRDRSGTLSKGEILDALRMMGLGYYSGNRPALPLRLAGRSQALSGRAGCKVLQVA